MSRVLKIKTSKNRFKVCLMASYSISLPPANNSSRLGHLSVYTAMIYNIIFWSYHLAVD